MSIQELLTKKVFQFIEDHKNNDIRQLAFQTRGKNSLPMGFILEQIEGYQRSKKKLPFLREQKGFIFPPKVSLEQCSSESTAAYKSTLIQGNSLIDITGGMGIDTYFLSKKFNTITYCELDIELRDRAKLNFETLQISSKIETYLSNGLQYNFEGKRFDCLYIDPARRDDAKNKVYQLDQCTPNIHEVLPKLFELSDQILIKASPMCNIDDERKLLPYVQKVVVVSVQNECKEVLFLLNKKRQEKPLYTVTDLLHNGDIISEYTFDPQAFRTGTSAAVRQYIYDLNVSATKLRAHYSIEKDFEVLKIAPNTILFTANKIIQNFPGKTFKLIAECKPNKKDIQKIIGKKGVRLSVRNAKIKPEEAMKKFDLKNGNDLHLFLITDKDGKQVVLVCSIL